MMGLCVPPLEGGQTKPPALSLDLFLSPARSESKASNDLGFFVQTDRCWKCAKFLTEFNYHVLLSIFSHSTSICIPATSSHDSKHRL